MGPGEQNYWQSQNEGTNGQGAPAQPAATPTPASPDAQLPSVQAPADAPQLPVAPQPQTPTPTPTPTPQPEAPAAPPQDDAPLPPPPPVKPHVEEPVTWEASEFVHRPKGIGWYAGIVLFGVLLLALSIFLLRDWFTTAGFLIMIVAVIVVAKRAPRVLRYSIDEMGIHVGDKLYDFGQFQSFGVLREGSMWSILFMPTARFKPPLSIYFSQEQGEKIIDLLGRFLPLEDHAPDMVDRLSAKLHF